MPAQRVPRPGSQKRNRYLPVPDESGGPGEAMVDIGPDFGESAGNDDETFRASVGVVFDTLAAEHDAFVASTSLEFTDLSAEQDAFISSADLVELVMDGEDNRGADATTNDGTTNWTSPTNAQGLRNGTEASIQGSATSDILAQLRLGYPNFTGGFETFTISLVELRFDTRQTGTVLNNGGLHHEYRINGGAYTVLQSFTGNVDNNPTSYDITAAIGGDWSKLDGLESRVRFHVTLGGTAVQAFCDAVELHVVAQKTVTL